MHLGVVKVGLLWLAKTEVFCQHIIVTKKQLRWKILYRPTLTTPNITSNTNCEYKDGRESRTSSLE